MKAHHLQSPLSAQDTAMLNVGDAAYLSGIIVCSAGLPTYHRISKHLERGEPLPIDIAGGSLFHLGSYIRETDSGGLEILYMNPTTSTRFNALMPAIVRGHSLRAVGGKGGLDAACVEALRETGCVYLSFLGGGAPIHTGAIRAVRDVAWNDLISHYRLLALEVEELGPLMVAIDAHGNSVYQDLHRQAESRLPGILSRLRAKRSTS